MANNDKKSQALVRVLKDELALRLPALTVTSGFDASQNPQITVGPGTAGGQNVYLRIIPYASIGVDGLGLSQVSYGPHVLQMALETSTVANVPLLTIANSLQVMASVVKPGTRVEIYLSANGTAPVVGSITGTPAAAYDSLVWPILDTM